MMALALRRLVGEDEYAVWTERLRIHESQSPRLSHVPEEALAGPDDEIGKTISRYSSIRSCSISMCTSCALPLRTC
jgi:hypothetical protein